MGSSKNITVHNEQEYTGHQPHRDTGPQGLRPTGTPAHRNSGPQGLRPTGTLAHRDSGPQGIRPTGTPAHENTKAANQAPSFFSYLNHFEDSGDKTGKEMSDASAPVPRDEFFKEIQWLEREMLVTHADHSSLRHDRFNPSA